VFDPTERIYASSMVIGTFYIPKTKDTSKVLKARDAIDVAARYFVYKLYEATDGRPMQWATLQGMDELRTTIARAVERRCVILQPGSGAQGAGRRLLGGHAALTDEGRRLARKGR
jgi:hypothetical protein